MDHEKGRNRLGTGNVARKARALGKTKNLLANPMLQHNVKLPLLFTVTQTPSYHIQQRIIIGKGIKGLRIVSLSMPVTSGGEVLHDV
jgi:hypothetical protein